MEIDTHKNPPLVSIGVPTFNRPAGLERALISLLQQTYKNIEIIISDNNSSDERVLDVIKKYSSEDSRIQYYRQNTNRGALANFQFVLKKATGKYFMWASDDDDRTLDCVEYYLSRIENKGVFFSSYAVRELNTFNEELIDVPVLNGVDNAMDISSFLRNLCPSMIYGLFLTEAARKAMNKLSCDWGDCAFVLHVIAEYGAKTERSSPKYFAGVQGTYKIKPMNGYFLNPIPYFFSVFPIAMSGGIIALLYHLLFLKSSIMLNLRIWRQIE